MAGESDTLWYLFAEGTDVAHKDDNVRALSRGDKRPSSRSTQKEAFLDYSDLTGTDRENFFTDILHVKNHGILNRQDAYPEKTDSGLRWVGDKKPAQTTDPIMRPWIEDTFPDARYLHVVRDPIHCIASMVGLGWADGSREFLVDYYVRLEQQALAIPGRLVVRYEDVCEDPMYELRRICEHLELDASEIVESYDAAGCLELKRGVVMGSDYATEARRQDLKTIPLTDELKKLMYLYGY